jgi:hypothetical protein
MALMQMSPNFAERSKASISSPLLVNRSAMNSFVRKTNSARGNLEIKNQWFFGIEV